jgi:DNA-binding NarL/FixJ family response regulator
MLQELIHAKEILLANELMHYGMPRRSGRYPWGSGKNPYQGDGGLLASTWDLKHPPEGKEPMSDADIAKALGFETLNRYREAYSYEKDLYKLEQRKSVLTMIEDGKSVDEIAERLNISPRSVYNYQKEDFEEKRLQTVKTVQQLKDLVDKKEYLEVGKGIPSQLGITETRLNTALHQLKKEGYAVETIEVPQPNNKSHTTTMKVLAKPGETKSSIWKNRDKIEMVFDVKPDMGQKGYLGIQKPQSISSDRIFVRYAEDGGTNKDGVIELRRGVDDLNLGNANYAQVRIAVDDSHYLKGMALYSDNIPDGYDVVFNTNKSSDKPKMEVFKEMKADKQGNILWDNPFGTTLKIDEGKIVGQRTYKDKDGNEKLSALNIVREEGDWDTWSKTLSAQFLSKQPDILMKQQLDKTYKDKVAELKRYEKITNPELKVELMNSFAQDCDSSASHLKAAALPRQSSKVILPIPSLKDNEVYAPTMRDGEMVALIRYPHAGRFEIPVLKVNNSNKEGNSVIGKNSIDAIGITPKAANQLSGADFDGDTVTIIPLGNEYSKNLKGMPSDTKPQALKELETFDTKAAYPYKEGMPVMSKKYTQTEMGIVSNLITDMTIQGATWDEIARAAKYSMVVIDAAKHKLNYRQCYIDNDIASLKKEYQEGGASTLISRANKDITVDERRIADIDKDTGVVIYEPTNKTYSKKDKNGNYVTYKRQEGTTMMREAGDAMELVSKAHSKPELIYADYANRMKALANETRKEALTVEMSKVNRSAVEIYSAERESLLNKLQIADSYSPYERHAQRLASIIIQAKKDENPELYLKENKDDLKKIETQALVSARAALGISREDRVIEITPKEWEAIQAGALSSTKIRQILHYADTSKVQEYALPKNFNKFTSAEKARINAYFKNGFTIQEIADSLAKSPSAVRNELIDAGLFYEDSNE